MKGNFAGKVISVLIILAGLGALGFGGFFGVLQFLDKMDNDSFFDSAETITAVCQKVSSEQKGTETIYNAHVKYSFDFKTYTPVLEDVEGADLKEGMSIYVYIDPQKPSDCRLPYQTSYYTMNLVFYGSIALGGLIFFIIGLVVNRKSSKPGVEDYERAIKSFRSVERPKSSSSSYNSVSPYGGDGSGSYNRFDNAGGNSSGYSNSGNSFGSPANSQATQSFGSSQASPFAPESDNRFSGQISDNYAGTSSSAASDNQSSFNRFDHSSESGVRKEETPSVQNDRYSSPAPEANTGTVSVSSDNDRYSPVDQPFSNTGFADSDDDM